LVYCSSCRSSTGEGSSLRGERSSASTVDAVLGRIVERVVSLLRSIQLLMGTDPPYDRHELLDEQN